MELVFQEFLGFLMSHSFTELAASTLTSMHSTQKPQWVGGCHFNVPPLLLLTVDCRKSLNAVCVLISLF